MSALQKLPPHNREAEEALLGSIVIDADCYITVATVVKPEDFYVEKHRWVYEAIAELHGKRDAIDYLTVCSKLEEQGQLDEVGGPAYVTELITRVPTSIHAETYAKLIATTATRRRLIQAAGKIAQAAYDEEGEIDGAIDDSEAALFAVTQARDRRALRPVKFLASRFYDHQEWLAKHAGELRGIPSGFGDIDAILGGFHRSDFIVIAARPAVGKSILSLNLACNAARYNQRVAFFSLEMSAEQTMERIVAAEGDFDSRTLRMGNVPSELWGQLMTALSNVSEWNLWIDDTPALATNELRSKARRLHAEYGLDMIVLDYLQLMRTERRENRQIEVTLISQALKALARELNIPVIAVSQLSRGVEARTDKRPTLSDLRESGSIEQEADVVMMIYRDEMYNENTERPNIADVMVSKHRHGPTGILSLYMNKPRCLFRQAELTSSGEVEEEPLQF